MAKSSGERFDAKDALNGMLRYTVRLAFPMGNNRTVEFKIKAFKADLLLRYASDFKKYVYDIVNKKRHRSCEWHS